MEVVSTIITVALLVVSVLLIVVVLLQKSKSAGVGGAFGSDTTSFTAKGRAASKEAKLQKATIVLGIILGVLAILLTIFK
jgi:preprotein translocase subunit SecG